MSCFFFIQINYEPTRVNNLGSILLGYIFKEYCPLEISGFLDSPVTMIIPLVFLVFMYLVLETLLK